MHIRCIVRGMGWMLALSMMVTEGLLVWQGRWREAVPLHLCSLSAIAAFAAATGIRKKGIVDFLWYLGLPGAFLALVFPAPASSRCQMLFTASYFVTHLLIILIPLALMRCGIRPRAGRAASMMLILQGIALAALIVNGALGTNFLFLSLPPAGTPLEHAFGMGYPVYIAILEAIILTVCLLQGAILKGMERLTIKNSD